MDNKVALMTISNRKAVLYTMSSRTTLDVTDVDMLYRQLQIVRREMGLKDLPEKTVVDDYLIRDF